MNSWTLFASVYEWIGPPVLAIVDTIIGQLSSAVLLPLKAGIAAWFIGMMLANAINPEGNPLTEIEKTLIKCAVAFVVATSVGEYNRIFRDVFLTNLSGDISRRVTGIVGGVAVDANAFDAIWGRAFAAGMAVLNEISWNDFGMQLLVVLYLIVALIAVALGFTIWLVAFVVLALLLSIGPLFVALFPFPATRQYFMNWISSILHSVITQVLLAVMLAILIGAENKLLGSLTANGANNAVRQVQTLLGCGALFTICGYIIAQIPGIAASLSNGAVLRGPSIVQAALTAASMARGGSTAGAAAGEAAAGRGAAASTSTPLPPGRSLSAA